MMDPQFPNGKKHGHNVVVPLLDLNGNGIGFSDAGHGNGRAKDQPEPTVPSRHKRELAKFQVSRLGPNRQPGRQKTFSSGAYSTHFRSVERQGTGVRDACPKSHHNHDALGLSAKASHTIAQQQQNQQQDEDQSGLPSQRFMLPSVERQNQISSGRSAGPSSKMVADVERFIQHELTEIYKDRERRNSGRNASLNPYSQLASIPSARRNTTARETAHSNQMPPRPPPLQKQQSGSSVGDTGSPVTSESTASSGSAGIHKRESRVSFASDSILGVRVSSDTSRVSLSSTNSCPPAPASESTTSISKLPPIPVSGRRTRETRSTQAEEKPVASARTAYAREKKPKSERRKEAAAQPQSDPGDEFERERQAERIFRVYEHAFSMITDSFTLYQPLLARVKEAYQSRIQELEGKIDMLRDAACDKLGVRAKHEGNDAEANLLSQLRFDVSRMQYMYAEVCAELKKKDGDLSQQRMQCQMATDRAVSAELRISGIQERLQAELTELVVKNRELLASMQQLQMEKAHAENVLKTHGKYSAYRQYLVQQRAQAKGIAIGDDEPSKTAPTSADDVEDFGPFEALGRAALVKRPKPSEVPPAPEKPEEDGRDVECRKLRASLKEAFATIKNLRFELRDAKKAMEGAAKASAPAVTTEKPPADARETEAAQPAKSATTTTMEAPSMRSARGVSFAETEDGNDDNEDKIKYVSPPPPVPEDEESSSSDGTGSSKETGCVSTSTSESTLASDNDTGDATDIQDSSSAAGSAAGSGTLSRPQKPTMFKAVEGEQNKKCDSPMQPWVAKVEADPIDLSTPEVVQNRAELIEKMKREGLSEQSS